MSASRLIADSPAKSATAIVLCVCLRTTENVRLGLYAVSHGLQDPCTGYNPLHKLQTQDPSIAPAQARHTLWFVRWKGVNDYLRAHYRRSHVQCPCSHCGTGAVLKPNIIRTRFRDKISVACTDVLICCSTLAHEHDDEGGGGGSGGSGGW